MKELSLGTIEQNLYWGAENLTRSGVGNVYELRNESLATVSSTDNNWFAKTSTREPVGVDDYSMEIVEEERKPPLILG